MAQQALGAGRPIPRRRVLGGLFDADGWAWAGVKAGIWITLITFMLAYIPDRAFYFMVNRTIDLGILAWSPVNLCPPDNEDLPCPAPNGAIVPWHPSPSELALPEGRIDGATIQVGTKLLYIGGSNGTEATATTYVAQVVQVGNFDKWTQGPDLPEPRSNASVILEGGVVYVFGGLGADGAPTRTAFVLKPNPRTGDLGTWEAAPEALTLPQPRAGAAIATAPDGLLLIGGSDGSGPVATTWKSTLDTKTAKLGKWIEQQPLVQPQTDGSASVIGDHVWLYGGSDAAGPVGAVQRGEFGSEAAEGLPVNPDEGKVVRWGVADRANLPEARSNGAGWSANGVLYLAGGRDASGPRSELFWTIPTAAGEVGEWKRLPQSDLPAGLAAAAPIVNGSNVILVGGETGSGALTSSVRANIAPQSPFFQLGLVGATVPALKIDGEIGQQLGYLSAAGAGTTNFILLLLLGWAFNHRERSRAMIAHFIARRRGH